MMKELTAEVWSDVLRFFDDFSELSATEQVGKCAALDISTEAKSVLQKMLAANSQTNILDQKVDPLVEALLGEDSLRTLNNPEDIIGRTFGAWQVKEQVACGGMGQVYRAQRSDGHFEKEVALKIIKSGNFSALSQQRFTEEMRTLAQFEHPNIARLIDGGTSDDGIAFFVMELISGEPIISYVQAKGLTLTQRIELFLQVLDAVEYAHQNLVIHGDIKPANILVNQSGQVKLVDFGIARPLDEDKADKFLPQFTPSYSSPEQAQGKPLTTASDVFGLCAVLYELCTGSSPRNSGALTTYDEYTEKLNTPIISALENFQTNLRHTKSTTINSNDKKLGRALSRELGAIIDKGLQIAVTDRYQNTSNLRRDLLLYLEGSAVPSYANSWVYRWKKSVIKYKWSVLSSTVAVGAIIMSAVVALGQGRMAQQEAEKANWVNQFLLSIFAHADPLKNQQQPITVNQLTAQAADQIMQDEGELQVKATSLEVLSQIQYKLGEVTSAEELVKEQINLMQKLPINEAELAAVYIKAGNILESQDKLEEAITHYRQALELTPLATAFTEASIRATLALANSLLRLNKWQETEVLIAELIDELPKIETLPAADSLVATLLSVEANLMLTRQQFDAAITQLQVAKARAKNISAEPLLYPHILGLESDAHYESGHLKQAADLDRELVDYFSIRFGEDHPETIDNLGRLAVSLAALGELQAAIIINQRITANFKGTEIKGHQVPAAYMNMGTAYQALGEDLKAIENYRKAQQLWPDLEPRIVIYEASTEARMAQSYLNLKQYGEAQKYFSLALNQVANEYGEEHALFARFQIMYAPLLLVQGRTEEASVIIPSAYQHIADAYGPESKNAAVAQLRWAQLNLLLGRPELAAIQAAKVIEVLDVEPYRRRNQQLIDLAKQISHETER